MFISPSLFEQITQPLSDVQSQPQNFIEQYPNPNGLFMVESAPIAPGGETNAGKKKNKKKKNKNDESLQNNSSSSNDRIVTLKNPMFYNSNNSGNSEPMNVMMRNLQTPPFISPMNDPSPSQASIIKNENGMYTIRNPTFQNAFGGSSGGGGSGGNTTASPSYLGMRSSVDGFPSNEINDSTQPPKCSSVIGSEMKNMLQRRKEQEFAAMDAYYQHGMTPQQQQQPSPYQHFSNQNFDRNGTECENFDGGFKSPYPMMTNFDELRSGQMLNSEVQFCIPFLKFHCLKYIFYCHDYIRLRSISFLKY